MAAFEVTAEGIDPVKENWGHFYRDTHEGDSILRSFFKLNQNTRPEDFIPRDVGDAVWWELAQIKAINKLDRTLLYLPFKANESDREEMYQDVRSFIEKSLEQELPARLGRARFIGFKPDGTAYLMNHNAPPTLGIVNLYGRTLKPFFKQVGVNSVSGITIHYFRIVELLFGLVIVLCASLIAAAILARIIGLIGPL